MTRWLSRYAIVAALILECLFLALATDSFFSAANLANVLRQNAFTAILAAGMTFVILTAGIDLSVGSVVGLSGALCAGLLSHGLGLLVSVAAALSLGLAIGLVNGIAITRLRVPAFVVTLAMMQIARGGAFKYTDARTISGLPVGFASLASGLSTAVIVCSVFGLTWLVLMRTPF